MLLLPYQVDKGNGVTKSLKWNLGKHSLNNVKTEVALNVQNIITLFNVNDLITFEHNHDVTYFGKCPERDCIDNYLSESVGRLILDNSRSPKCVSA